MAVREVNSIAEVQEAFKTLPNYQQETILEEGEHKVKLTGKFKIIDFIKDGKTYGLYLAETESKNTDVAFDPSKKQQTDLLVAGKTVTVMVKADGAGVKRVRIVANAAKSTLANGMSDEEAAKAKKKADKLAAKLEAERIAALAGEDDDED